MIKTYKMKKLIVFIFSVVLLGSCSKCFECEFENRIDSTVCSTDFDSKQDWKNYIEKIEIEDSVKCYRKIF